MSRVRADCSVSKDHALSVWRCILSTSSARVPGKGSYVHQTKQFGEAVAQQLSVCLAATEQRGVFLQEAVERLLGVVGRVTGTCAGPQGSRRQLRVQDSGGGCRGSAFLALRPQRRTSDAWWARI